MKTKYSAFLLEKSLYERNSDHDISLMISLLQLTKFECIWFDKLIFMSSTAAFQKRNLKQMGFVSNDYKFLKFRLADVWYNKKHNIVVHVLSDEDFKLISPAIELTHSVEISDSQKLHLLENSFVTLKNIGNVNENNKD